ncbi:MAG: TetR/AcrR family transcriptional regulator [Candidatus Cloacimonetes bacterium]|nr:TetR/AcrR family transcriptional regulator [Candidatus Cloacimonadota bacterium]
MNQAKEKPQMIIEIAAKLFARYGYNKTSLDDVATEAQIAKGTIYYYFHSKEELYMSVIGCKAKEFIDSLIEKIAAIDGFENKLKEFLFAPIRMINEKMPVLLDGLSNIPYTYRERFEGFRNENRVLMLKLLVDILDKGKQEGLLSMDLSTDRLAEAMNDWFLMGDRNFLVEDIESTIKRIERDHEILINMILYGIIKRGM